MSILLTASKSIFFALKKSAEKSRILHFFDKFSGLLEKSFEKSAPLKIIDWIFLKLKESFIGKWFLRPEEEVDVFNSSKAMNYGVEIVDKALKKNKKYSRGSFIIRTAKEFISFFLEHIIFSISMIVLSAALANSILWVSFKDFELFGLIIRLIVIAISSIGIIGSKKIWS
ncbi:MAG: hypothetical protein ACQESF_02390 [Nanobdellota archaeon]